MRKDPELLKCHKNYSIYSDRKQRINYYSGGAIESLQMIAGEPKSETNTISENEITVRYRSGEEYTWKTKYIDSYNIDQFGIAVSTDGTMVFAQTWDNGLFCFDAKSGARIWRTKSRRGITDIFVSDDTITAHLHEYAIHLIDIKTGEVIKEKRPCTAWGFDTLDNKHIVCQVTARKWEIIEAETLDVKETFKHSEFTGGNTDFCINDICLCENGKIRVSGFKNVWDSSGNPPKRLPNIEFEYFLRSRYFEEYGNG